MSKTVIHTQHAPAAVGPYSQAIRVGQFVYTAGQIPLDPASGNVVSGSISAQTERALRNLEAVLTAAGARLENVVKTTVFLQDMDEFGAMNSVYAQFFGEDPPARSAVEVAALPLGVRVEIEAVAFLAE
ncbi:MAG: RidA family protein [Candidatus Promineifilaceae bacterium]|nr:RidA family protein [Candidatus Promineifilaceae bacterium]